MTSTFKFWQRFIATKQIKNTRKKPRRVALDFETLENRYGPTPGVEMGLSVMGFAFANPLGIGVRADTSEISAVPDALSTTNPQAAEWAPRDYAPIETAQASSRTVPETPAPEAPAKPTLNTATTGLGGSDFVHRPYDDLADNDQLFFQPSRPSAPGGGPESFKSSVGSGAGADSGGRAGTPPSSASDGPGGSQIPQFQAGAGRAPDYSNTSSQPNATSLPQVSTKTGGGTASTATSKGGGSSSSNTIATGFAGSSGAAGSGGASGIGASGGGAHPAATVGVSTSLATLYVMDNVKGLVLTPNVAANDFSTYTVQLDADLVKIPPAIGSGFGTPSYSWNLSSATDASSVSGSSSYRLNFTWASFSGATRTDSITINITDGTNNISETVVFHVASTSAAGYSASQPTTTSTWPAFLPPDAVNGMQTLGGSGPYFQYGLTDGEVQMSHTLPSYNPSVAPLQLMYVSTAAVAEPIFVAHYQIPTSDTTLSSISAQLTFNGNTGTSQGLDITNYVGGDTLQIALQAGATSLATGRYSYSFQVKDTNASTVTTTYSGSVDIVNTSGNAFGRWFLSGVERAYSVTGGVLLDLGNGQSLWFASSGSGTFTTPAGDFSTLTQNTLTSVYTRTMPDGTKYQFNSSGYQTAVQDRNSNTTSYSYDGSNKLTSIKDLNNQVMTLAYSGTSVTSITDPANRITTLSYDGNSLLTTIKDPDAALWTYTYTTAKTPNNFTTPTGATTAFGYFSSHRAHSVTLPDSSIQGVTPTQQQGLLGGISPPAILGDPTIMAAANAINSDGINSTDVFIDWTGFGEQMESIDTLNETTITNRDSNGLSWQSSDGLANATRSFFNGSGYATKVAQGDGSTTQYTYNSFNEVSQTTDGLGNLSTSSYDANGNMTQVKDAIGNLSTYTYTSQGLVSTTKDSLNHVVTYSYNTLNELTQTTDSLGNLSTSLYDSAGNMTTSIDSLSHRTTYSYDSKGRETQTQDATGALTTSLYDGANNRTTSIDALGHRTTMSFDGSNRVTQTQDALGNLTTSLFDNAGRMTTSIDALAHRTTYSYDGANRQTQVQDALSNLTTSLFDSAGNMTTSIDANGNRTTYSYDSNNRQTQVKDALGDLSTSVFDSAGNMIASVDRLGHRTSYSFDANNRQTQVKDALGNLSTSVYDIAGNETTSIDARGSRTTFTVDSMNRTTQTQDATGAITTVLYDQVGNQTTSIDALGHRTTTSYDGDNRQTQVQDALGHLTTTLFDAGGNETTSIDALGDRVTFGYDARNRQTSVKDANNHIVTTVYDAADNVTTTIDASGATTTTAFDALNRQTSVKDAGLGVATTVYDKVGNITNSIDQMGDKTTFAYDGLNRRTTVIDELGSRTTTVFDAVGNSINVIDPDANKTTFAYDALNRRTRMTDPLGNTGTMAYDAAGRQTSVTDRDGRLVSLGYDSAGRETGETWTVSDSTVNTFTFTFDSAGDLLTAANSAGTYTMAYDTLNRVTNIKEPFGLALTYGYDSAGRKTQTVDLFGGTLTSVYDGVGNLTTREFGGTSQTPLREDLTYTSRNQIATETRYSDLAGTTLVATSADTYDSVGRVTNIQHAGTTGTALANYTYTYDLASRLTSEQDNGTSTAYGYDATSQLTSAGASAYSYDANGNRTMAGYSTGAGNQLLNDGTWTYTYDAEGNMTKKSKGASAETWLYTYDNRNHMTGAKRETTDNGILLMQATYVYDAMSNRIEKDVWSSSTGLTTARYGYDSQNAWVDLNGSNGLQMRRMYLEGVDQVFARVNSSGDAAWYLADHLGSVREVVNSTNTITDTNAFDAWGEITSESNPGFGDRYKYTAREFDDELGMQYNRAREYNSVIARWTSQDPLAFIAGDTNLYRYVANSPLLAKDPTGMDAYLIEGKVLSGEKKVPPAFVYRYCWAPAAILTKSNAMASYVSILGLPPMFPRYTPDNSSGASRLGQMDIWLRSVSTATERPIRPGFYVITIDVKYKLIAYGSPTSKASRARFTLYHDGILLLRGDTDSVKIVGDQDQKSIALAPGAAPRVIEVSRSFTFPTELVSDAFKPGTVNQDILNYIPIVNSRLPNADWGFDASAEMSIRVKSVKPYNFILFP
jgi:RHS repeat-associated protein